MQQIGSGVGLSDFAVLHVVVLEQNALLCIVPQHPQLDVTRLRLIKHVVQWNSHVLCVRYSLQYNIAGFLQLMHRRESLHLNCGDSVAIIIVLGYRFDLEQL